MFPSIATHAHAHAHSRRHVTLTPHPLAALPYVLPVLVFRLAHSAALELPRAEPAEELRLLLATVLRRACERVDADVMPPFLHDVVPLLVAQLSDPFPAVRQVWVVVGGCGVGGWVDGWVGWGGRVDGVGVLWSAADWVECSGVGSVDSRPPCCF